MLKYYTKHKFIFAAGLAAFIHTTWSFAVIMSGELPDFPAIGEDKALAFASWLLVMSYQIIPAALMAYAIDVGQIEAAEKIREGNNSLANLLAFIITAICTFYLQFLFMIHHMPLLEVSPGAAPAAAAIGVHVRNAAIWIMPALLPLALIVRMTSDTEQPQPRIIEGEATPIDQDEQPQPPTRQSLPDVAQPSIMLGFPVESEGYDFPAACPYCDWEEAFFTTKAATEALNRHVLESHQTTREKSNGHH